MKLGPWRVVPGSKDLLGKKFSVLAGDQVVCHVADKNARHHAKVISVAPDLLRFVERYEQATHALDMGPEHHFFRNEAVRILGQLEDDE